MPPDPVPIENLLIHADFVRALAADLARDPALGDDLAQEAWLQSLRRPPRDGTALRGWLATLLASLCANHARAERRRVAREAALPAPPPADAAADIVAKEQVRQRLLAAVLALDEPFRTAVLLRYYEGLSSGSIARRLGVPAATVRTRVARGLERLRTRLDAEHGPGEDRRRAWVAPLLALPAAPPAISLPFVVGITVKKSLIVAGAFVLALAAV